MNADDRTPPPWRPGDPATGPALWTGAELSRRPEVWRRTVGPEAACEIVAALAAARARGFSAADLPDDPSVFPLPSLEPVLAEIRTLLADGPGFALLGGLPLDGLSPKDAALMVRGVGTHLGLCVSQNHRGERIGQVMDLSDEIADPRRYQAGGEFRMHVDPIDIVGLLCVRKASEGGESHVVSAPAVHNAIMAEHPELMAAFYEGFRLYRPLLDRCDAPPLTARNVPVFAPDAGGRFASLCLPDPILQGVLREGVVLSPSQEKALAVLDHAAHRPDLVLEMDLEPGDLQLLNNRVILHGRTEYRDHPDKDRRRLMLRLWLMVPEWPPLHPDQRFFDDWDKAGGGIPQRTETVLGVQ